MIYTNESGQKIHVEIEKDCGMVMGRDGKQWHKVICKPVGYQNCPQMILDRANLKEETANK